MIGLLSADKLYLYENTEMEKTMDKMLGRPRSEETKRAILSAAYALLSENGFEAVTIEGIAKKAGVSKATIYKWWPGKAAVVLDGYFAATELLLPVPDTGSVTEDLFIQADNLSSFITSPKGKMITELIGAGQSDPSIAEEYRKRFFHPRRLISKGIIERGIERGELRKDLDVERSIDLIFAPLFYRLLITGDPLNTDYLRDLIKDVLIGLGNNLN